MLSLNEKTDVIEPAKIKGLLDMGVKSIYEIETEDGKKIRTTGNHPYLARNSNGQNLINVDNGNIFQSCGFNIINCPQKSLAGAEDNNLAKEESKVLTSRWGILNQTTAKTSSLEKNLKPASLVTTTRLSFLEDAEINRSSVALGTNLTSNPLSTKKLNSSTRTFSSRSHEGFLSVDNDIMFASNRTGVLQSGFNLSMSETGGESTHNLSNWHSSSQHFQNLPDHNSGSFESGFSVANFRVSDNVLVDFNSVHSNFNDSKDENELSTP